MNLLVDTAPLHAAVLTMGISNWLVAFWEDAQSYSFLGRVFRSPDSECPCFLNSFMYSGYAMHHFTAIFAFGFCLATGKLGGLCSIGLFFEAPFILATWRELALTSERAPTWLQSWAAVRRLYAAIFALFIFTRVGASGLYLHAISDGLWLSQVDTLDNDSRFTFYVMGAFFTCLTCVLAIMLCIWCGVDASYCTEKAACTAVTLTDDLATVDSSSLPQTVGKHAADEETEQDADETELGLQVVVSPGPQPSRAKTKPTWDEIEEDEDGTEF